MDAEPWNRMMKVGVAVVVAAALAGAVTAPAVSGQTRPSVAFITYDAGETLALLPVAPLLRERGIEVEWVPLTPWVADLLADNGEPFLPLPDAIAAMPHLQDREVPGELDYWESALARAPPDLAVLGMVSSAQGELADRLGERNVPTRGYHDGFQPPTASSISARLAGSFDEIWVPTERVKDGFEALGLVGEDARIVVTGQPTLEAWRRAAAEVDATYVRRRLRAELVRRTAGAPEVGHVLTWAGQYGEGYEEVLGAFLRSVAPVLAADTSLLLVLSPHPRVNGNVERSAIGGVRRRASESVADRILLAPSGLSTMELATVSDVVLTWASTVGTQAAFMGKEVIYVSPPVGFDDFLVQAGATRRAEVDVLAAADAEPVAAAEAEPGPVLQPGSLPAVISQALDNPHAPEDIRSILVEAGYVLNADEVVAGMIAEVVGASHPPPTSDR